MIKTFRGLLADGQQERIRLEHRDGKTGYRIVKFEVMDNLPGQQNVNHVVQVWSIEQTAVSATVNFSEQTLLGAATEFALPLTEDMSTSNYIIFDRVTFNQDIFITHVDTTSNKAVNYYLELEQISLDDIEATAVILKNFRNTNTVV